MPIYEYSCGACGHQLEAFQKMSEAPLTDCPACHQSTLAKLVSAAGFQLKGTGWYATDFKNKGKPDAKPASAANESAASTEGGAKTEGSSKTEPETKTSVDTKGS